jgi:hypothetical protein
VNEGTAIYQKIEDGEIKPAQYIERFREAFPTAEQSLERIGVDLNKLKETATDAAMSSGKILARQTLNIGQNAFSFILNLCLMLYLTSLCCAMATN